MSLRYYPLTQVLPNQYTNGRDFVDPDGKPYTGRYYITSDNECYTGINPVVGTNRLLTRIVQGRGTPVPDSRQRDLLISLTSLSIDAAQTQEQRDVTSGVLRELTPYYPFPIDDDYARGYFTRYFAKNVTGPGYVVEISQDDWTNIQDGNIADNILAYETADMLWQLTGPLNDRRVSQYQIIGGVYDTNKRVTEAKAKGFLGLVSFIGGDYTKFARITP